MTPACPRCGGGLASATVRTVLWQQDAAAIVENIPAHVCRACAEQFYDDAVGDALRRLAEVAFSTPPDRIVAVPVFSLERRVRNVVAVRDDAYVD